MKEGGKTVREDEMIKAEVGVIQATFRSWKRQGKDSPLELLEGMELYSHLGFSPIISFLGF